MPPNRKAGRLEIEVAADMEKFDRQIEREVPQKAKRAGERFESAFDSAGRVFQRLRGGIAGLTKDLAKLTFVLLAVAGNIANLSLVVGGLLVAMSRTGQDFGDNVERFILKPLDRAVTGIGSLASRVRNAFTSADVAVVRQAGDAYEGVGQRASIISRAFQALRDVLQPVGSLLRRIGESVGRFLAPVGEALRGATASSTAFVRDGLQKIGSTIGPIAQRVSQFAGVTLKVLGKAFGSVIEQVVGLTEIGLKALSRGLRNIALTFADAEGTIRGFGRVLNGLAATASSVAAAFEVVGKILFGFRAAVAITAGAIVLYSNRIADAFAEGFNRVRTLIGEQTPQALGLLREEIGKIASETGIAAETLNGGFYQTLSALPNLVREPLRALEILRVGAQVAATGFADLDTAIRALTGIMNAFDVEAEEAAEIADALFAAQDRGVTTFGEIAGSIGRVTGLLKALNLDWRDLLAIITTASPFLETSEIVTAVGSALESVLDVTPDAEAEARRLGIQFDVTALQAQGLVGFLDMVGQAAEGNVSALSQLFGRREAVQLLAILSTQSDRLAQDLDAVSTNTGKLAENLDIMGQSTEFQSRRLKEAVRNSVRPFGTAIEGLRIGVRKLAADIVEAFNYTFSGGGLEQDIVASSDALTKAKGRVDAFVEALTTDAPRRFRADLEELKATLNGLAPQDVALPELTLRVDTRGVNQAIINQASDLRDAGEEIAERMGEAAEERAKLLDEVVIPLRLQFAETEIDRFRTRLEAIAALDFLRTKDADAFESAMRDVNRRVNEFIGAQIRSAQEAGATLEEVGRLTRFIRASTDEAREAAQKQESAVDSVSRVLAEAGRAAEFGIDQFAQLPAPVQQALGQVAQLDAELERMQKAMEDITDPSIQAELQAQIDAYQGQRDAAGALLTRLLGIAEQLTNTTTAAGELAEMLDELDRIGDTGFDPFGDVPDQVTATATRIGRLEADIERTRVLLASLKEDADVDLRIRGEAALDALERALADTVDELAQFERLKPIVDDLGIEVASAFEGLDTGTLSKALDITADLVDEFSELRAAQAQQRAALLAGDQRAYRQASERTAEAQKKLRGEIQKTVRSLIAQAAAGGLSEEQLRKLIETLERLDPELFSAVGEQRVARIAGLIEEWAQGMLRVAEAFGEVDDQTRRLLAGIGDVAAGIGRLAQGDVLGGAIQGAVGIAGVIEGLFGDPEIAREREELRTAINRLRESFERAAQVLQQIPGRIFAGLQDVFQDTRFLRSDSTQTVTRDGRELELVRDPQEMVRRLRAIGLTLEDIQRISRETGLPLDDLERAMAGLPVNATQLADDIFALQQAFGDLEAQMGRFFDTVTGGLDRLRAEANLFDQTTEQQTAALRKFIVEMANLGDAGKELAGLDLSTEAGRARAEAIIESVAEEFFSGNFDVSRLGEFSPEEFLAAIQDFEGFLDSLQEEEGDEGTTDAGVFQGVTVFQADILVAAAQTQIYYLQDIATTLRAMAGAQGITLGQPLPVGPVPGFNPGGAGGAPFGPSGPAVAPTPPPIPVSRPTLQGAAASASQGVAIGQLVVPVTIGPNSFPEAKDAAGVREALGRAGARETERAVAVAIEERYASRGRLLRS